MILFLGAFLIGLALTQKMKTGIVGIFSEKAWYWHLQKQANHYGIPIQIAEAMVYAESKGNEKAIGSASELGLMQIKKVVLDEYNQQTQQSIQDLTNPFTNISVGLWYLNSMNVRYKLKNLRHMLLAYNNGIGSVRNWLENPEKHPLKNPLYADLIFQYAGVI